MPLTLHLPFFSVFGFFACVFFSHDTQVTHSLLISNGLFGWPDAIRAFLFLDFIFKNLINIQILTGHHTSPGFITFFKKDCPTTHERNFTTTGP
jgi:hypothetical protein